MPVKEGKDSKGCYYQYGEQKKYYYKCGDSKAGQAARRKAELQGRVIEQQWSQPIKLVKKGEKSSGTRILMPAYGGIPSNERFWRGEDISYKPGARIPKSQIRKIIEQKMESKIPDNAEIPVQQPSRGLYDSLVDLFKGWGFGDTSESTAYYVGSEIETKRQEQGDTRESTVAVTGEELSQILEPSIALVYDGKDLKVADPDVRRIDDDLLDDDETAISLPKETLLDSVWNYLKEIDYVGATKKTVEVAKDTAYTIAGKIQELRDAHQKMVDRPVTQLEMETIFGINKTPIYSTSTDVMDLDNPIVEQPIGERLLEEIRPIYVIDNTTMTTASINDRVMNQLTVREPDFLFRDDISLRRGPMIPMIEMPMSGLEPSFGQAYDELNSLQQTAQQWASAFGYNPYNLPEPK